MNAIGNFIQDVRYAMRGLRRDPTWHSPRCSTLAICIGANTTVFSLVNSIILRPLPYPESQRLYWVTVERTGRDQLEQSQGPDYYSIREENKVFEDVAAYDTSTLNWTRGAEKAEQLNAAQVSPSFFNVFATRPMMGRYLAPTEEGARPLRWPLSLSILAKPGWASDSQVVGKEHHARRFADDSDWSHAAGIRLSKRYTGLEAAAHRRCFQRPRSAMRPMRIVNIVARLRPSINRRRLDADLEAVDDRSSPRIPARVRQRRIH